MNHTLPTNAPGLASALDMLSELAETGHVDALDRLAAELSSVLARRPSLPPETIPPRASHPGLDWHLDQLRRLCGAGALSEPDATRRCYHARMLGHCLAPERADFHPSVTVLIPVHNRAGPLVEAVQSCLEQSWSPIEILVIDDGSTDDPAAALARFGQRVRLHRKPHGGVAGTRNLGIRLATGDFIHFLDSDDLLLPRAIESKLAAFRAIADAELCYGQSQWVDMRASQPSVKPGKVRSLDNPSRSMIVAFPFLLQTVMMPRWRVLAAAPFEEDLRRSSDFRFWQCLSLSGITVAGSLEVTTRLRRFHDSLHQTPEEQDDSHAVALARGLRDLARHPSAWPYGAEYLNIVAAERARYWLAMPRSERVGKAVAEAVDALAEAGTNGPSPLPMFAAMRAQMRRLKRENAWLDQADGSPYQMIGNAIEQGHAAARALTAADIAFWSREQKRLQGSVLTRFFAALHHHCGARRQAPLADRLLRATPRVPRSRAVKRAAQLQPFVGAGLAVAITERWRRRE